MKHLFPSEYNLILHRLGRHDQLQLDTRPIKRNLGGRVAGWKRRLPDRSPHRLERVELLHPVPPQAFGRSPQSFPRGLSLDDPISLSRFGPIMGEP